MTNSKKMAMEQLETVAGGNLIESLELAHFLRKAGYKGLFEGDDDNYDPISPRRRKACVDFNHLRKTIDSLGFNCDLATYGNGNFDHQNTYVNKETGMKYTHREFMNALHAKFPGV